MYTYRLLIGRRKVFLRPEEFRLLASGEIPPAFAATLARVGLTLPKRGCAEYHLEVRVKGGPAQVHGPFYCRRARLSPAPATLPVAA